MKPLGGLVHVVIVPVPVIGGEPAHEHADLRFVLTTDDPGAARAETPEAPLRWVTFPEAYELVGQDVLSETLERVERTIL